MRVVAAGGLRLIAHGAMAAVVAALLLTACGPGRARTAEGEVEVGEDLAELITTTTAPTAAPTIAAGPAGGAGGTGPEATTATTRREGAGNQSVRVDPAGFRLVLTFDGSDEGAVIELAVTNVSGEARHYDSMDAHVASIRHQGAPVWQDTDCRRRQPAAFTAGPVELGAGETVRFHSEYPGTCSRLPAGRYEVLGGFRPCPPSARTPEGACDQTRAGRILSAPLTVTFD